MRARLVGRSDAAVNLYCSGYNCEKLRGSRENTEIGAFIAELLELDLAAVTRDLRRCVRAPLTDELTGRTPKAWFKSASAASDAAKTVGIDHYHSGQALGSSSSSMHLYLDDPARR